MCQCDRVCFSQTLVNDYGNGLSLEKADNKLFDYCKINNRIVKYNELNVEKFNVDDTTRLTQLISIDSSIFISLYNLQFEKSDGYETLYDTIFNKLTINSRILRLDSLLGASKNHYFENIHLHKCYNFMYNKHEYIILYFINFTISLRTTIFPLLILNKKEIITLPNTQFTDSLAPFGDANNDGNLDYVAIEEKSDDVEILLYQLEKIAFRALDRYSMVGMYSSRGDNTYKISHISSSFKKIYKSKGCF